MGPDAMILVFWMLSFKPTFCDPMNRSTPALPAHHQLQELTKLMCIELVMPSSHLILCRPLLLLSPIPPSIIRVFSNESILCMRWPEYWSFSLSISPSNKHPGLVSFRTDWLDLLAVQGTHKGQRIFFFSPAPQFKSINSLAFSFLYSPTLTSINVILFIFVLNNIFKFMLLDLWMLVIFLLTGHSFFTIVL